MAETKQKAKKERVMVFIDGSNLYHVLNQHFSRNDIKFGKFAEKLAGDRNIIKYNKSNGKILEKIEIPDDGPDPHGLSIKDKILWYSDAAFPNPMRPFPEIGSIELRWIF